MKRDIKKFTNRELECYELFKVLLKRFGYTNDEITGSCRQRRFFEMRQRVALALYQTGRYSTIQIGLIMNRDHSSVLNMINANIYNRKREIYLQFSRNIAQRRNPPGRKS